MIVYESHAKACTFISSNRLIDINIKFSIFAVLERWLIYDCENESSCVYLILSLILDG